MKIKNKTGRIVHLIDDSLGYREFVSVMPFCPATKDKPAEFESVEVPDVVFKANEKLPLIAHFLKEGELIVIEAPAEDKPAAPPAVESEQIPFGRNRTSK